jgi:hypothetical protein
MKRERPTIPRMPPVRVFRLGSEPGDDLSRQSTAAERVEMVATLSQRMWDLTGRAVPAYARERMPVRVLRGA